MSGDVVHQILTADLPERNGNREKSKTYLGYMEHFECQQSKRINDKCVCFLYPRITTSIPRIRLIFHGYFILRKQAKVAFYEIFTIFIFVNGPSAREIHETKSTAKRKTYTVV